MNCPEPTRKYPEAHGFVEIGNMHKHLGKKRAGPWSPLQGGGGVGKGAPSPPPPQSKFFGVIWHARHSTPMRSWNLMFDYYVSP